jgi:hypothetical protein
MKTIHEQISELPIEVASAYEANFFPRQIEVCQKALRSLLAVWDELRLAQAEGITEITIRSRSTSFTLAVPKETGASIAMDLYEHLGKEAAGMSNAINCLHEDLAKDGESAGRISMLNLLLTPVGPDGMALPVESAPSTPQGPFLATPTPLTPARPRRRTAA